MPKMHQAHIQQMAQIFYWIVVMLLWVIFTVIPHNTGLLIISVMKWINCLSLQAHCFIQLCYAIWFYHIVMAHYAILLHPWRSKYCFNFATGILAALYFVVQCVSLSEKTYYWCNMIFLIRCNERVFIIFNIIFFNLSTELTLWKFNIRNLWW